jgi:alginate O-acetyltransferase complex protein AlgJ
VDKDNKRLKLPGKTTADLLLAAIFVLLIALPFLGSVFGWDLYERQSENRALAAFPSLESTPIAALPEKLEAYYNDHFGFRNTFIRKHRKIEKDWFGRSSSRVVEGSKDGWLFYGAGGSIDDYLGNRQLTGPELAAWETAIGERTRWMEEKGIPYIFMVMPDKAMLYPEYLPENIQPIRRQTRFEQLNAHLTNKGFHLAYPIKEMLQAKQENLLYYPSDTHWNDHGAYVGYEYLIHQIKTYYPSFEPIPRASCLAKSTPRPSDISKMLNGKGLMIDDIRLYPPQSDERVSIEEDSRLVGADWVTRPRRVPTRCDNPTGTGTAVVIHDSFYGQSIRQLLPTHFKTTYFFYMYAETFEIIDMIDRLNPDIVIEMRVERSLRHIPGQKRDKAD